MSCNYLVYGEDYPVGKSGDGKGKDGGTLVQWGDWGGHWGNEGW